jgi:RNA polymerase sigma factor (sigma-70 family)
MDVKDEAWRRREADLWRRWSEDRDLGAREELVGHYLPIARNTAVATPASRSPMSEADDPRRVETPLSRQGVDGQGAPLPPRSDVLEALEFQHDRSPVSLDLPPKDADADEFASEWLGTEDGRYEDVQDRAALRAALPTLEEREAEVVRLRFFDELTQGRIAERLGCSQMQVSRILRRALEGLRQEMRT